MAAISRHKVTCYQLSLLRSGRSMWPGGSVSSTLITCSTDVFRSSQPRLRWSSGVRHAGGGRRTDRQAPDVAELRDEDE